MGEVTAPFLLRGPLLEEFGEKVFDPLLEGPEEALLGVGVKRALHLDEGVEDDCLHAGVSAPQELVPELDSLPHAKDGP